MNWSDERYIRAYTRDTLEWQSLPWQSRAIWFLMLRRADRAGVLAVRPGPGRLRMLATAINIPVEVVEPGVAGLLEDGCLVESDVGYVVPNFLEAQECSATDAARQRKARETRRAKGLERVRADGKDKWVTQRDHGSQNVTNGHNGSQRVTTGHNGSLLTEPSLTEPNQEEALVLVPSEPAPPGPVEALFEFWRVTHKRPGQCRLTAKLRRQIQAALKDYPLETLKLAVVGLGRDPWPERRLHLGLQYALRDVEKFVSLAQGVPVIGPNGVARDITKGVAPPSDWSRPGADAAFVAMGKGQP